MRAREWKRLTQPVLGDGWRLAKTLAYRVPVRWILHGILGEDSAAQRPLFYIWVVRMPLFVPTEVISLSWSERFGGPSQVFEPGAAATEEALSQAARQALKQAYADGVVIDSPGGVDNVGMQEARGYGLLLEGNLGGALEVLAPVIRFEPRYP